MRKRNFWGVFTTEFEARNWTYSLRIFRFRFGFLSVCKNLNALRKGSRQQREGFKRFEPRCRQDFACAWPQCYLPVTYDSDLTRHLKLTTIFVKTKNLQTKILTQTFFQFCGWFRLISLHIRSMWETICDAWACWSGWKFGPNSTEYPYSEKQNTPPKMKIVRDLGTLTFQFQNPPPPENWNLGRSWHFVTFQFQNIPPPAKIEI